MTLVRRWVRVTAAGGDVPAVGKVLATPTRTRIDRTGATPREVLPAPVPGVLDATGLVELDLEPSTAGWAWTIELHTAGHSSAATVAVPDVATVDYADLEVIDPATLEVTPAATAAWTVATEATAGHAADAASSATVAAGHAEDAASSAAGAAAEVAEVLSAHVTAASGSATAAAGHADASAGSATAAAGHADASAGSATAAAGSATAAAAARDATLAASTITGAGRPDVPATMTTAVANLVAAATSGAVFRSTDGPQGAWLWQKKGTAWSVVDGDTGWRALVTFGSGGVVTAGALSSPADWAGNGAGGVRVRRVGGSVFLSIEQLKTLVASTTAPIQFVGAGFRPAYLTRAQADIYVPSTLSAISVTTGGVIGRGGNATWGAGLYCVGIYASWPTVDAWPTVLPGVAG